MSEEKFWARYGKLTGQRFVWGHTRIAGMMFTYDRRGEDKFKSRGCEACFANEPLSVISHADVDGDLRGDLVQYDRRA
jgi:hypothetical protein